MARALLQEDYLARSLSSYEDFLAAHKTYPLHIPHRTVYTDHEEDIWMNIFGLEKASFDVYVNCMKDFFRRHISRYQRAPRVYDA